MRSMGGKRGRVDLKGIEREERERESEFEVYLTYLKQKKQSNPTASTSSLFLCGFLEYLKTTH